MLNTMLLSSEDVNVRTYSSMNVFELTRNVIDIHKKRKIFAEMSNKTNQVNLFFFSDGSVQLSETNQIYSLEHLPENTDLILPKNPKLMDFIVLYYEQSTSAAIVSFDKKTRIKLYGNGNRLMGLDEPLICDMPFMSLKLVFAGEIEGWVIC